MLTLSHFAHLWTHLTLLIFKLPPLTFCSFNYPFSRFTLSTSHFVMLFSQRSPWNFDSFILTPCHFTLSASPFVVSLIDRFPFSFGFLTHPFVILLYYRPFLSFDTFILISERKERCWKGKIPFHHLSFSFHPLSWSFCSFFLPLCSCSGNFSVKFDNIGRS